MATSKEPSQTTVNPVTANDVRKAAADLGFKIADEDVGGFRELLAATHEDFELLSSLPDYHPPTDKLRFPRRNVRKASVDRSLGSAWSYRCSIHDEAAEEVSGPYGIGPLTGKNVVVKDNVCIADVPQHNGTDALQPWVPQADATVVRRILEAGGQIVGTATCEALSCATVSNTASGGPIHNPWANGYSAGGSSSGTAALVAGFTDSPGLLESENEGVHMGIGADQGGSIRVPSALCGLIGLKATHGLIPYTGVVHCEAVLDHVGPMCRSVWDAALMLEAIAGMDEIDDRQIGAHKYQETAYSENLKSWYVDATTKHGSKPLSGMKIGVLQEAVDSPKVTDTMKEEIEGVSQHFHQLGAEVQQVSIPLHVTGRAIFSAVCRQSLSSIALGNPAGRRGYYPVGFQETMIPWTQEKWDQLPAAMWNELLTGQYEKTRFPHLYEKAMNLVLKLRAEYESVLKDFDVLLTPSCPVTAPPLFDRDTTSTMEKLTSSFGLTANTLQFNISGHPAMTLPTGLKSDISGKNPDPMLPVGVQLVSCLFGEEKLLRVGHAYEKAFEWKKRVNGESES